MVSTRTTGSLTHEPGTSPSAESEALGAAAAPGANAGASGPDAAGQRDGAEAATAQRGGSEEPSPPSQRRRPSNVPTGRRLQTILTSFIVAIVLGGSVLTVFLTSRVFERVTAWTAADLEWKAERGANEIAHAVEIGILLQDEPLIREGLREYIDQTDFASIVVTDPEGNVLVEAGEPVSNVSALFAGKPGRSERKDDRIVSWATTSIEGEPVGRVGVAVSTERLKAGARLQRDILILSGVGCGVALVFSFFFVYYYIGPLIRLTEETLRKLRDLNLTLESKVEHRTSELAESNYKLEASLKELRQTQRQLVDTSRAAGMAEVATSVLHNVGNVLNSVNVSVSLALEKVEAGPAQGLKQVSAMLRQHEADIPGFFANHPKGRLLVDYIHKLAEANAQRQAEMTRELSSMRDHVDHIKVAISTQQSLAKSGGMIEPVSLRDLIDETLSLSRASFAKQGIELVHEPGQVDIVQTDRNKLFQVLVNLLNNARDAMRDEHDGPRRITLRIGEVEGNRFFLEVEDTGCGIAAENIDRIFTYGFSTKSDGHGFGLHGSACSIMELGGALTARSDGPGRGAVFRVELPRKGEERAAA